MEPVKIDGSFGEGGGQIVRTAVTLSAITGRPVDIQNIRKNRKVPGLRPQHLLGIKILANICQAKVEGLHVNSTSLRFSPAEGRSMVLEEDVGTAGSIPLILQVLIPSVSLMKQKLRISIKGGTDVPWSPTSNYTKFVMGEAYSRIGINFLFDVKRRGYYPKGGGLVEAEISPANNLRTVSLTSRTEKHAKIFCSYSKIPRDAVEEEIKLAKEILIQNGFSCQSHVLSEEAMDKGCSFLVFSSDASSVIGSDAIYRKDFEGIGGFVANRFLEYGYGVDPFLSDMLVLPLSLIKDTSILRINQITKHLETNLFVASKLTGCKYGIGKIDDGFELRLSGLLDT